MLRTSSYELGSIYANAPISIQETFRGRIDIVIFLERVNDEVNNGVIKIRDITKHPVSSVVTIVDEYPLL